MTRIEWTRGDDGSEGKVWNPTTGCDRTSPGCDRCYALTMAKRLKAMGHAAYQRDGDSRTSGPGFALTPHPDRLSLPLTWQTPRKVFVNSMSDLFHPDVPDEFIGDVWNTMGLAAQHTFQVLTKRSQRMAKLLTGWANDGGMWRRTDQHWCGGTPGMWPLGNVWLGVSVENDRYAFRSKHLRATPAAVRFLSLEPLLGPLPSLKLEGIDWVIVGGESGAGARPMHPDWVRDIRDRCADAGTPFFFKQTGTVLARELGLSGKGHELSEVPEEFRIRQMPKEAAK